MSLDSPRLDSPVSDEDCARANLYALIGRLFYDAPDAGLLAEIRRNTEPTPETEGGTQLMLAWRELQNACKSALPVTVRQEYESLFVGVGKALVTPYTARYVGDTGAEKHLVRLRQQLAAWGLGRRDKVFEFEDHISGLCDVMRYLIENNQSVMDQKQFFSQFVYPLVMPFFKAVEANDSARFYRAVTWFARAFFELEQAAWEMTE